MLMLLTRVSTRGILSAGDDVLRDIGLSAGLGMTIPGTGRLGKRIIEAPLRRGSKGLGQRLDMRRVQQLPEVQVAKQKAGLILGQVQKLLLI